MTQQLIDALVEKNAFASDTIVTANYQTTDLFGRIFKKTGDFKINRILKSESKLLFELVSLQDASNTILKVTSDSIKAVDGMDLGRFADIYDLLPNGSKKKVGRKRGRKPKNQLTA
jgi:hypothetical protein